MIYIFFISADIGTNYKKITKNQSGLTFSLSPHHAYPLQPLRPPFQRIKNKITTATATKSVLHMCNFIIHSLTHTQAHTITAVDKMLSICLQKRGGTKKKPTPAVARNLNNSICFLLEGFFCAWNIKSVRKGCWAFVLGKGEMWIGFMHTEWVYEARSC